MIMMVAHQKTCDDFAVALMDSYLTYRNIANLVRFRVGVLSHAHRPHSWLW